MNLYYTITILIMYTSKCISKKYNNYTLYRGIPVTEDHVTFFKNLSILYEAVYWRSPGVAYRPVEFMIAPDKKMFFTREAMKQGIYYTTLIDDVQNAFNMQTVKSYQRRNMDSFDWKSYFRIDDIYNWLQDLNKMYPKRMHIKSIGKTHEKRDILVVQIFLGNSKRRPKVIVEGGIHAREWISVAFVTYFLHEILTSPESRNEPLKSIAAKYEWHFVPVLNPDGYEYTHVKDRMHRKNINKVDLNRNFAIQFGTVGTSSSKDSETYCGTHAFSEPETTAMGNLVRSKQEMLKYYFAFHSYGQYMIIPYAYSSKHEENFDQVQRMGFLAAKKIERRYGTQYVVGTAYDTVGYMTSGVSGCWVKKSFNVPFVLTFELRDDGRHGFALPPKEILPTCYETMDGIISLLTPEQGSDHRQRNKIKAEAGAKDKIIDSIVIVWNIVLFIIVRFD